MTVAILAGGASRRMGTDKASLYFEGQTLLERAARTARAAGLPVLIVGRTQPDGWCLADIPFAEDEVPGRGPLGGLHTALGRTGSSVLALACDMPLLTPEALVWLQEQAEHGLGEHGLGEHGLGEHGLAVVNHGQWEPLFSVYTPLCLPLIDDHLRAGKWSLHRLIQAGDFQSVDSPDWVAAHLVNVNTADDLARLGNRPSQ